jgi:hypothetical protein
MRRRHWRWPLNFLSQFSGALQENPRPCLKLKDEDGVRRSDVKLLSPIGHAFHELTHCRDVAWRDLRHRL